MAAPYPRVGLILLVVATLGWGTSWPAMKIALNEIPPWTFRAAAMFVGGTVLLVLARLSGLPLTVPRNRWRPLLGVIVPNMVGWNMLSAIGLSLMVPSRAAVIAHTMPVWAGILGVFLLGEALSGRRIAALGLGMGGIWLLMAADIAGSGGFPLGAVFMLGAAMAWALGTVLMKRVAWDIPMVTLTGWQMVIGSVPVIAAAVALELPDLKPLSVGAWVTWVYVILGTGSLCNYAWIKVVNLLPVGVSTISTLMMPVLGVFSSALFLGDPVGWREVGALVLVCSALALVFLPAGFGVRTARRE